VRAMTAGVFGEGDETIKVVEVKWKFGFKVSIGRPVLWKC
jgi:predicted ThiF/HesA family dinucleotide-utilizing enzyme